MSNIDLSKLSIDDLKKLTGSVDKEIGRQQKAKIEQARADMEKIAARLGMTAAQVLGIEKKRKTSKTVGVPKYRNPADASQTWTGRGKRPGWYNNAIKKGKKPEDLEIK